MTSEELKPIAKNLLAKHIGVVTADRVSSLVSMLVEFEQSIRNLVSEECAEAIDNIEKEIICPEEASILCREIGRKGE